MPILKAILHTDQLKQAQDFDESTLKYRLTNLDKLPLPPIATLAFQRSLYAALAQYYFFARRDGIVEE